jgi:hypothetical protein
LYIDEQAACWRWRLVARVATMAWQIWHEPIKSAGTYDITDITNTQYTAA